VRSFLQSRQVEIDGDALSTFIGGLPGHRSLANAEMEKLAVYAHNLGRPVRVTDVQALCETNADESARQAVLMALSGDPEQAQAELDRVIDTGLSPISLIRLFEMEASRMLEAQALQGEGGASNVGMKLKPPVWKSDWPAFQSRLRKWPTPRLTRLVERLHDLELMAKSPGGAGLAEPATRALFISLYKAAAAVR
jgi:DNA polymerase-3 subunit delta